MNTRQLLSLQKQGMKVYHNGAPVQYRPREKGDRAPWAYWTGTEWIHYTASACQVAFRLRGSE